MEERFTLLAGIQRYVLAVAVMLVVSVGGLFEWACRLFHAAWEVHFMQFLLFLLVAHLGIGVYLGMAVRNRLVVWHNMATLDGVAGRKVAEAVLWPVAYPVLFLKLAIARHL